MEDASVHHLEGEFRSVISALRSKLDSRAAPPILHLDTVYLQEDSPNSPPLPASSTGAPGHTGTSSSSSSSTSSSQESRQPWSLLSALMSEIQKLGTQEDAPQSETSADSDVLGDVNWSATSEDFTFEEDGDRTEIKSSASPEQSTTVGQPVAEGAHTETTADPRQTVNNLSLRRKYRSLLRKRQIPGANGKSTCRVQTFIQHLIFVNK